MLKINEIFGPTIQGEGKSAGKKVFFLRLAMCNLHCVWCDTPYTWNWIGTPFKHPDKFDKTKEIHEMDNDVILDKLKEANAVVISGGEPLIQQRNLLNLIGGLKKRDCWIEIETNGTLVPDKVLLALVDQINCSLKLSNSGDSKQLRVRSNALEVLAASEKVYFKFVVSCEKDIEEILEYVRTYAIASNHVYLMPLGKTPGELTLTKQMTRELADKYSFIFSDRLHITLFGAKRGV